LSKPSDYHGPGWSLAWRKLDVCGVWSNSWRRFGCRALFVPCQNEAERCRPDSTFCGCLLPLGTANSDLQSLLPELGIFPCRLTPCGRAVPGWPVSFRLAHRLRLGVLHAVPFFLSFVSRFSPTTFSHMIRKPTAAFLSNTLRPSRCGPAGPANQYPF